MKRFVPVFLFLFILTFLLLRNACGQDPVPIPPERDTSSSVADSAALATDPAALSRDSAALATDPAALSRDSAAFSGEWAAFSTDSATLTNGTVRQDSLVYREPDHTHSPTKAIMFALVLPGLGQAYNGKYYKIPIVWAALGGAVYAISFNTGHYRESSLAYAMMQDDNNERALRYWRRNMELSYISLIAVFALQVIDAYVDAQLYYWDVNENLSMRVVPSVKPILQPFNPRGAAYGLTWSLNLKGN